MGDQMFICLSDAAYTLNFQCCSTVMPHNHDGLEWLRQCRFLSKLFFSFLAASVLLSCLIISRSVAHFFEFTIAVSLIILQLLRSAVKSISRSDVNFFLIASGAQWLIHKTRLGVFIWLDKTLMSSVYSSVTVNYYYWKRHK